MDKTCRTCAWSVDSGLIWPHPYDDWLECSAADSEIVENGPCPTCGFPPNEDEELLPRYRPENHAAIHKELGFDDPIEPTDYPIVQFFAFADGGATEAELLVAPDHSCALWVERARSQAQAGPLQGDS